MNRREVPLGLEIGELHAVLGTPVERLNPRGARDWLARDFFP